jgi:hypothetical protein
MTVGFYASDAQQVGAQQAGASASAGFSGR